MITTPASLRSFREIRILRRSSAPRFAAMARTTFREGVAIMQHRRASTFPSPATPPTPHASSIPLQAPTRSECIEQGKKYFSVASGGGTGRTLHPDNMAAGPASYGMTDTMGRMHSDAQFAGSSSVPAHVEMMGSPRHGQQPHGRRNRRGRRRYRRGNEEVIRFGINTQKRRLIEKSGVFFTGNKNRGHEMFLMAACFCYMRHDLFSLR